jgi:hypothetical protein
MFLTIGLHSKIALKVNDYGKRCADSKKGYTAYGSHKYILSSTRTRELRETTQNMWHSLKDIPGIYFEEKGHILAVHYRNVSQRYFALIH